MPTGKKAGSLNRAMPRLPEVLEPLTRPTLETETEWSGVEVSRPIETSEGPSDLEVSSSLLRQVRLAGQEFERVRLVDVVLEDCDLSAASLLDASFVRVEFRRCRMSWIVCPGLKAKDVRLWETKLDEANFRMTTWERTSFEGCDLTRADFYAARMPAARLVECNLTGAQFSKVEMGGTALHRSTLEGVRGGESFRGVVVGTDQVLPLSLSVFAALGIVVDDEHPASTRGQSE